MEKTVFFLILLHVRIGAGSEFMEADAKRSGSPPVSSTLPIVVNTWPFVNATRVAWRTLDKDGATVIDAIEAGCMVCEKEQCDGTVGYGGSPDENGESSLDAMIMDGTTMNVGAVGYLRRVKSAISVARQVLEKTKHTLLVGELATQFAVSMGFPEESLSTKKSKEIWKKWRDSNCQPNFWQNVVPDPKTSCGPYSRPKTFEHSDKTSLPERRDLEISRYNHDTIGMIAIDGEGNVAAGTSTNGATHKIPGRVGDSPITGAGAYADSSIGAAVGTGDGDVLMRFLPSFRAVLNMAQGIEPEAAAEESLKKITQFYPDFSGAVVAVDRRGNHGAACHGFESFQYSVFAAGFKDAVLKNIPCRRKIPQRASED
ncbi:hypothetical protein RvY_09606 [Ramazzottius varieornatus]|uniref:N(4)-(beta-N-acetylglucosaminyl)-L-asparaginase n=1 Tax=Ramazzottius varieornatus TaxID=947166 RepID=A0A1D1V9Z9_RAMVA|nr:hypothetical protein RvY_09606 [Ramazzottius varieornatus]